VLLAERRIIARIRDRRFYSLGEANAAVRDCVAEINARPFQKLDGSPAVTVRAGGPPGAAAAAAGPV